MLCWLICLSNILFCSCVDYSYGNRLLTLISEFNTYSQLQVDEYHPRATRTLFIGNLEKDVTIEHLKKTFEQFGEIIVSGEGWKILVTDGIFGE